MERNARRNPLVIALVVLGIVVVVAGIGLVYFGIGAELDKPKTVTFVARIKVPDKRIADFVKPGDPVYTDTAGMQVGEVESVDVTHAVVAMPDKFGQSHLAVDPVNWQIETKIKARGRVGNGLVLLDTQVLQVGQLFSIISQKYYLPNALVVSLNVQ
jgi:Domain of unknown function (DUF4330)